MDNLFVVPDESFEADLDENFEQAYRVIKKIKKYLKKCKPVPVLTKDNQNQDYQD